MKRRIVLGFGLAALLLVALVSFVGRQDVLSELAAANYRILALGLVSGLLALIFRGLVWIRSISTVAEGVSRRRIGSLFLTAMFLKYVTPYGQLATEPFVAYLVSYDEEMAYEDGFAGIVSADLLNYIPYYTFGFVAIAAIAAGGAINDMVAQLFAFGGLFVVVVALAVLVLQRPGIVYWIVLTATGIARSLLGRVTDRFDDVLSRAAVTDRLDGFYDAVGTITRDRKTLAVSVLYAHLGMAFLMLPVYIAAVGLGYEIGLPIVALVVALGKLGFVVPSPGGVGGVEAMVTGGLVAFGGLSGAAALTIALIFRLCTYWLTIAVGGLASIGVLAHT